MPESTEYTLVTIYESILAKWKENPKEYTSVRRDFRKDIWRHYNKRQTIRYKAREVDNALSSIQVAV